MECSYISVDLETTGLDPKLDKIIEIGLVKVRNGQLDSTYSQLVNPRREVPEKIVALTGIHDGMLKDAPPIETVIGEALEFCEGLPLLGHHIIFDYSFLKRAAVNHGLDLSNQGIDTLAICRRFMPEKKRKNLENACNYFGIRNEETHRALSDAMSAWKLFETMNERFAKGNPEGFLPKTLVYKVKREQPALKRQKEHLRDLLKYHKINLAVQIEYLSRNEASRMTDKIISQYGRMDKEVK